METLHVLGIYWDKLIAQAICFLVVLLVLQRYAYKPMLDMMEKRRTKIAESLANAERIKQELANAEIEHKKILAEAHDKAVLTLAEAHKTAAAFSEKKMQEAVVLTEEIIKKAEASMALEREKMMSEVKREVARLVVETAGKVTGKVLTEEDQNRLNAESIRHLAA